MTTITKAYLQANYTEVRTLKDQDGTRVTIVTGPDGVFYVRKESSRKGLPYAQLQQLHHAALPKLYFVEEDEQGTLVLEEYINGRNLADIVLNGPLPEEQVRDIALQLCSVLTLLHEHQLLHRDLKPSNIILQEDGRVKLIDFDAARRSIEQQEKTQDTKLLGTRGYAPPEQFGFAPTDARSDLYALGRTMAVLLGEQYQGALTPVIAKVTQVDAGRRYASAETLALAIRHSALYYQLRRYLVPAGVVLLVLIGIWWQGGFKPLLLPPPAAGTTPTGGGQGQVVPGTKEGAAVPGSAGAKNDAVAPGAAAKGGLTVPGTDAKEGEAASGTAGGGSSSKKQSGSSDAEGKAGTGQGQSRPAAGSERLDADTITMTGSYTADGSVSGTLKKVDDARLALPLSADLTKADSLGLKGTSDYVQYLAQDLDLSFQITNDSNETLSRPYLWLYINNLQFAGTDGVRRGNQVFVPLDDSLAPGATASVDVSLQQPVLLHGAAQLLILVGSPGVEGPVKVGNIMLNGSGK